ncbi:class I SAM-dependent methyltransferase [Streptomyces sp. NBC_01352]|uniref:class I SAM-dependent methyltransferase n=1 Tax=unclassified Streptomyces TaxID=2593676 RepID=UPI00225B9015|nr:MULTISPECIES: class I SAM-dependent methyltransferase [unclassified Streptomyces]MCX4699639.1 class I SAM-dependent methyltransferase [Streptomyces sp. NBC_01373]
MRADALAYLRGADPFDAVYSVYGAVWFTDPAVLLPAVRGLLRPGGTPAFSQRPPVEGCYGCQASYIPRGPDEDPLVVKRWDYEPEVWEQLLGRYGYTDVRPQVLPRRLVRARWARSSSTPALDGPSTAPVG